MALWRFVLLFALVAGSVVPHCATATPVPVSAAHYPNKAHDGQQHRHDPSKAHVTDACIGCATPVRFTLTARAEPMATAARYIVLEQKLATRFTALDPPPPRQAA
jgi:hypothetical protein